MNILFVHVNFPAQFKFLSPALAQHHKVVALTMNDCPSSHGIQVIKYNVNKVTSKQIHPWASEFETKIIRAEACYRKARELKESGFNPDVIIAHPGWGESLFLKDVWPKAKLGIYCEFFYKAYGADYNFDPEFLRSNPDDMCKLFLKNTHNILQFETADAGISPTEWQASSFPSEFRKKITVIHDGIDTAKITPNQNVILKINNAPEITKQDEVITFVNRNLEPYRGYHIFMRSLPEIMAARPNAKVLIVGGDKASYGEEPPGGQSWKKIYFDEIKDKVDTSRIFFLGHLPYESYMAVLQASSAHIYLTYPFVLSWSLLEAMSIGAPIIASSTPPVTEVINGNNGLLFNFFSPKELAAATIKVLSNPDLKNTLSKNARAFVIDQYDLRTKCLPAQLAWFNKLSSM